MAPIKEDWSKKSKIESKNQFYSLKIPEVQLDLYKYGRTRLTSRAVSALSSSAPALKMLTGARERDAMVPRSSAHTLIPQLTPGTSGM